MIKLHHLNNSRSQKTLWLLEELGLEYDLVCYQRDKETLRGPPAIKALHPLGKAPMLEDDGKIMSESGAIADYLLAKYGDGKLQPSPQSPEYMKYKEAMYFAISAGMNPIMVKIYCRSFGLSGSDMDKAGNAELETALNFIETLLADEKWLLGDEFTAADIQMSFIPELADVIGAFKGHDKIRAWQERLYARPAFQRSIAKGGVYDFAGFA